MNVYKTCFIALCLCFSQAGDGDDPEQEEDGVCGEALPGGVRERGFEAGGRRHLVQEQPLHGKDGFKGEFKLGSGYFGIIHRMN